MDHQRGRDEDRDREPTRASSRLRAKAEQQQADRADFAPPQNKRNASGREYNTRSRSRTGGHDTLPCYPQDMDQMPHDAAHLSYVHQYQQQQQQQQFMQQQVHQGGFWPTPPNYNLPRNPPRNPDFVRRNQGLDLPTPPRTSSPPGTKRKGALSPNIPRRDAIVPPSRASGGVPDPTPPYLLRASFLPRPLRHPQPLLVIIDLNGTLLFRPSSRAPRTFVERPFAKRFLSYCVDTFHVMIWSSARPLNVRAMCDELLDRDQLERVVAVWGRDRFGLTPEDFNRRVQCYKRLSKVWEDPVVKASFPADYDDAGVMIDESAVKDGGKWKAGCWNQGNTVLIDDSKEKARSEPHNAIEIPEFLGDQKDLVLPQVHDYLNLLACQADVSTYIRVNPFKVGGQG